MPKKRPKTIKRRIEDALDLTGTWKIILAPYFKEKEEQGVSHQRQWEMLQKLSEQCTYNGIVSACYALVQVEAKKDDVVCIKEPDDTYTIGILKHVSDVECDFFEFLRRNKPLLDRLEKAQIEAARKRKGIIEEEKKPKVPLTEEEKEERRKKEAKRRAEYRKYIEAVKDTDNAQRGEFLEIWHQKAEMGEPLPFTGSKMNEFLFYDRWFPTFKRATEPLEVESSVGWRDPKIAVDPMIMATYDPASPRKKKGIIGYVDSEGRPIPFGDQPETGIFGERVSLPMVIYFNWLADRRLGTNYSIQQYDKAAVDAADIKRVYEKVEVEKEEEIIVEPAVTRYSTRYENPPPVEAISNVWWNVHDLRDIIRRGADLLPGIDVDTLTRSRIVWIMAQIRSISSPLSQGPLPITAVRSLEQMERGDLLNFQEFLQDASADITILMDAARSRIDFISGVTGELLEPEMPEWAQPTWAEREPIIMRLSNTSLDLALIRENFDQAIFELGLWHGRKVKQEERRRESVLRWDTRTTREMGY